jgi:nucleotide-binding universal stress UspA family protein
VSQVVKQNPIGERDVRLESETSPVTVLHRVLVAITDDDLAPAVIAFTRALEDRRGAKPSALYVIEVGVAVPDVAMIAVAMEEELQNPEARAKREAEMRAVLHIGQGAPAAWPFGIEVGMVASTIVDSAQKKGAELIVMGLNRHAAVSRAIGNDTVREVMTLGGVPVLAIRPQLMSLPKRIVVAVDFSHASIRAAHLARSLIDDSGVMHLLFVESAVLTDTSGGDDGLRLIQEKGVEAAFKHLVRELEPTAGMTIDTVIRKGNPMREIPRYCEEIEADLIAVGSQRHRFLDRMLLGSVAKSIAADGRWSTLVTPPVKAAR